MSVFGNYNDLSNQILREGQEISIKFQRNNDGTGTVSWNIPPPANGCTAESQAYDGIVITVSEQPANYISTSPKNKVIYNADNTLNLTANLGDKIDYATVIGAFYHDKTTTSLVVTDIDPKKWYYISGYAVDNVGTYHREGVHAYSLPTGIDEGSEQDYSAYHDIVIVPTDGSLTITGPTLTGLDVTKVYNFTLKLDGIDYTIEVNGSDSTTYTNLIAAINNKIKYLGLTFFSGALPPHANELYLDIGSLSLYTWDGYRNNYQNMIIFDQDPATKPVNTYWYNSTSSILSIYNTSWDSVPLINLDNKPTEPYCGQIWFTGTDAYEWDGDHWIKLCLYVQPRSPQLAPVLNCNTYWYNKTTGTLNKWDDSWTEVLSIVSKKDPNTLSTGDFWYDETTSTMMKYAAGSWNELLEVRYDTTTPDNPAPNIYWFNPTTQDFFKRDSINQNWLPYEYTLYPTDPLDRKSNDLWWNQNASIDTLYVWDIVNNRWLPVDNFYQSEIDPSLPLNLPTCVVWFNPTDNVLKYIIKSGCTDKNYISSLFDPTAPTLGTTWFDTKNKLWYVWNGTDWVSINPIISAFDPFNIVNGSFWFNPVSSILNSWDDTQWVNATYSTTSLKPNINDKWLNTTSNVLFTWMGSEWDEASPVCLTSLKFITSTDTFFNGKGYLHFETTDKGCSHQIEVVSTTDGLFTKIKQSVVFNDPVSGSDGVATGQSYNQLGVGTDGSPDERRSVHDYIKQFLGYPTVQVELFKSQIDVAIDTALLLIRKYSGFAYTRNFFFLDLKPNQQIYTLANRCVGFNKIVHIKEVSRMRSGWIRTGFAGNEMFGIAALQQMYTAGSFDMLSFHLLSSYVKELEQLFATRIVYNWDEKTRNLKLYQQIMTPERVLIDAFVERTEQDLLTNRETSLWIKRWALAEAKAILGQSRGKYVNLAGPNGSTSLNAQDLLSQSSDEKEKLKEELLDPAMQDYNGVGASVDIAIG